MLHLGRKANEHTECLQNVDMVHARIARFSSVYFLSAIVKVAKSNAINRHWAIRMATLELRTAHLPRVAGDLPRLRTARHLPMVHTGMY